MPTYIDLYTMEYVTITKYHGIRNTMNIGPLYHEQIDNIRNAVHRATIKILTLPRYFNFRILLEPKKYCDLISWR